MYHCPDAHVCLQRAVCASVHMYVQVSACQEAAYACPCTHVLTDSKNCHIYKLYLQLQTAFLRECNIYANQASMPLRNA